MYEIFSFNLFCSLANTYYITSDFLRKTEWSLQSPDSKNTIFLFFVYFILHNFFKKSSRRGRARDATLLSGRPMRTLVFKDCTLSQTLILKATRSSSINHLICTLISVDFKQCSTVFGFSWCIFHFFRSHDHQKPYIYIFSAASSGRSTTTSRISYDRENTIENANKIGRFSSSRHSLKKRSNNGLIN